MSLFRLRKNSTFNILSGVDSIVYVIDCVGKQVIQNLVTVSRHRLTICVDIYIDR